MAGPRTNSYNFPFNTSVIMNPICEEEIAIVGSPDVAVSIKNDLITNQVGFKGLLVIHSGNKVVVNFVLNHLIFMSVENI